MSFAMPPSRLQLQPSDLEELKRVRKLVSSSQQTVSGTNESQSDVRTRIGLSPILSSSQHVTPDFATPSPTQFNGALSPF
ncbi:hypothetical protein GEMRC1_011336 [Eukaryota sp. GEM-RC1]